MKLNADVGEGFGPWSMGDDPALMPHIHLANIACGGHASDPYTMQKTVRLALEHGVQIGAHPSYPDIAGFGRRVLPMEHHEAALHCVAQLGALDAIVKLEGGRLEYVKPHGALYNQMMAVPELMAALLEVIATINPDLKLMILATPEQAQHRALAAQYGVELLLEAFADRRYTPEGRLLGRTEPGAVYHDPALIMDQAEQIIYQKQVTASDGRILALEADVICVHGDNHQSIANAAALRAMTDQLGLS